MAFRPGQSGNPNGRAPGSKNKVSLRTREGIWKHIEQLAVQGKEANPFATLINLMLNSEDEHIRLHAAVALSDRLLPKLKATEHSGEVTTHILTGDERRARIEALLAKRNGHAH